MCHLGWAWIRQQASVGDSEVFITTAHFFSIESNVLEDHTCKRWLSKHANQQKRLFKLILSQIHGELLHLERMCVVRRLLFFQGAKWSCCVFRRVWWVWRRMLRCWVLAHLWESVFSWCLFSENTDDFAQCLEIKCQKCCLATDMRRTGLFLSILVFSSSHFVAGLCSSCAHWVQEDRQNSRRKIILPSKAQGKSQIVNPERNISNSNCTSNHTDATILRLDDECCAGNYQTKTHFYLSICPLIVSNTTVRQTSSTTISNDTTIEFAWDAKSGFSHPWTLHSELIRIQTFKCVSKVSCVHWVTAKDPRTLDNFLLTRGIVNNTVREN